MKIKQINIVWTEKRKKEARERVNKHWNAKISWESKKIMKSYFVRFTAGKNRSSSKPTEQINVFIYLGYQISYNFN